MYSRLAVLSSPACTIKDCWLYKVATLAHARRRLALKGLYVSSKSASASRCKKNRAIPEDLFIVLANVPGMTEALKESCASGFEGRVGREVTRRRREKFTELERCEPASQTPAS